MHTLYSSCCVGCKLCVGIRVCMGPITGARGGNEGWGTAPRGNPGGNFCRSSCISALGVRESRNRSRDFMLKSFILARFLLQTFLFAIVCSFDIGGEIPHDCHGNSTMTRGREEFRICQDCWDRYQLITVLSFYSHVAEYPYSFLSAQCERNLALKHFWEVCHHAFVTLECVQG